MGETKKPWVNATFYIRTPRINNIEKVLNVLQDPYKVQGVKEIEIIHLSGLSPGCARKVLNFSIIQGWVEKLPNGNYVITKQGQNWMNDNLASSDRLEGGRTGGMFTEKIYPNSTDCIESTSTYTIGTKLPSPDLEWNINWWRERLKKDMIEWKKEAEEQNRKTPDECGLYHRIRKKDDSQSRY